MRLCQIFSDSNFQQLSKLINLKFIWTTWHHQLTLTNKVTHQQITTYSKSFQNTIKTVKRYKNWAPCLSWNYCWLETCAWSVFSFHMSSAWVKHQMVGINILMNELKDFIIPYLGSLGFDYFSSLVKTRVFSLKLYWKCLLHLLPWKYLV